MGVEKEVWIADIREKVIPENSFMTKSVNHDAYVEGRKVHVPLALSRPGAVINRVGAGTASRRNDTTMEYAIDDITSNPTTVTKIEESEVSYPKRQSVLKGHIDSLSIASGVNLIKRWAEKATAKVTTSGKVRPALLKGATGNRKGFDIEKDGLLIRSKMGDMMLPTSGRHIIMPTQWCDDIIAWVVANPTSTLITTGSITMKDSSIDYFFGMKVWERPPLFIGYVNGTELKYQPFKTEDKVIGGKKVTVTEPEDAPATAKAYAIAWHEDYVCRALGAIDVIVSSDAKEYGDVFSSLMMFGGSVFFEDTGVVLIEEGVSS
jgi:hypothetical protein